MDSGNSGILFRTPDQAAAAQGSQGTLVCTNGYNVRSLVLRHSRWILHCYGRAKQYAVESLCFSTPNEPKYFWRELLTWLARLSITNLKLVWKMMLTSLHLHFVLNPNQFILEIKFS